MKTFLTSFFLALIVGIAGASADFTLVLPPLVFASSAQAQTTLNIPAQPMILPDGNRYRVTGTLTFAPPPNCGYVAAGDTRSLVDANGDKWSMGPAYPNATFPGNHDNEIFKNGQWFAGAGAAIITVVSGSVYVQTATNDPSGAGAWWAPTATSWVQTTAPFCTLTPEPAIVPQVLADSPYVPPGYFLSFNDEFASLDLASNAGPFVAGTQWYNGNVQCCLTPPSGAGSQMYPTPGPGGVAINPFSLDANGGLDLTATKSGNAWNSGAPDTVANDGHGFVQQYGYFEMYAQLPAGSGSWPAFWMRPLNGVGEIDIIEAYTLFQTGYCMTLSNHQTGDFAQGCNGNPPTNATLGPTATGGVTPGLPGGHTISDGYHLYALLWTPTQMQFLVDGVVLITVPTTAPWAQQVANTPYYLIFDLGVGGGGQTSDPASPSVMKIKWIRAYQAQ